ncbi:MAG: pantetheine-phosphate adenylyltransferase [Planctomycetota bacterium]
MPTAAVYAGSFDPPTNGHAWMIRRGAAMFPKLIIAVARNPEKKYTFPLEQRLTWLRDIAAPFENVEVAAIENAFLAHYARDRGAQYVIRGIRNEDDYQYERAMRYVNADLNPDLSTVFLIPPRSLCEISSSFVKGMIGPEGWEPIVERYVPAAVYRDLDAWVGAGFPKNPDDQQPSVS